MERTQLIRDLSPEDRILLIQELNQRFRDASAEEVVGFFLSAYQGRIALSSSLSIEDQTLTDIIVRQDKNARIFTLDTGRLFPETYQLIDKTNLTYGIRVEVFFPDYREVQRMVHEEGINLFYNSIESRHPAAPPQGHAGAGRAHLACPGKTPAGDAQVGFTAR